MDKGQLLHVFLAEDSSADMYLVREALVMAGLNYVLHWASDGEEALNLIERFGRDLPCPDVALIDLNLPRHDGSVLLMRWRERGKCTSTPLVILTSSDAPADQALAAQYHAVFFRKPLDMEEFFRIGQIVRRLCGAAGMAGD